MCRCVFTALLAVGFILRGAQAQEAAKPDQPAAPERLRPADDAFKAFDKDGDGKLNEEERQEMVRAQRERFEALRKEREKQYDKNGDGVLDEAERAAMREAMSAEMAQARPELMKRFDKDGDGKLSAEERKEMIEALRQRRPEGEDARQAAIKRFDKNGDGRLDEDERKAMMEAHRERVGKPENRPAAGKAAAPEKPAEKPAP